MLLYCTQYGLQGVAQDEHWLLDYMSSNKNLHIVDLVDSSLITHQTKMMDKSYIRIKIYSFLLRARLHS